MSCASVFAARLWATVLCGLLLAALPVFAFDEDHREVINGATLHFRVRGTDKAHPYLVILHGGPGFSAHMFYAWGPSLEKTLNVVYLDQRGSGESARLTVANVMAPTPAEIKGYTIANLVEDMEGVRRSLKVDKWYVLGHSYGGMLGLEYVTAHPDHVLGYIHMDGSGFRAADGSDAVLDNAQEEVRGRQNGLMTPLLWRRWRSFAPCRRTIPLPFVRRVRPGDGAGGLVFCPAIRRLPFAAFYRADWEKAIKPYNLSPVALAPSALRSQPGTALIANDHFLTRDDTPLLSKVTVPTLIINGKQDGVIPPSAAAAAHTVIKGSQLVELDHCGHFPFVEQPEKTTAAVLAFVASQKADTTFGRNNPAAIGSFSDISLPDRINPKAVYSKTIVARWDVDEQGEASHITLNPPSGNRDIDRAIIQAVHRFRFRPATHNGLAVPVHMTHTFTIAP